MSCRVTTQVSICASSSDRMGETFTSAAVLRPSGTWSNVSSASTLSPVLPLQDKTILNVKVRGSSSFVDDERQDSDLKYV